MTKKIKRKIINVSIEQDEIMIKIKEVESNYKTEPINAIIKAVTDIAGLAVLPYQGAIVLVIISMLLTFIAGLIPSKIAAKKDPVTSLRTE